MSDDELKRIATIGLFSDARDFVKSMVFSPRLWRLIRGRMRSASIVATGGHHLLNVFSTRRGNNGAGRRMVLSVFQPISEMVEALDEFQPVMLTGYAGTISLLASEQEMGNLSISPVSVSLTGESLPRPEYDRIAAVFGARVNDFYGTTEAMNMSRCCEHGWHHVLSDWIIFEPVDENFEPSSPGTLSHTVLLTVLYRRTQPVIRYNLGDAVLQRPDPCPCGNPHPAFRVQGRAVSLLQSLNGNSRAVAQLIVWALSGRVKDIQQVQVQQAGQRTLRVRLLPKPDADPESTWNAALAELSSLLRDHGLDGFTLERTSEPPQMSPGGKFQQFLPAL